MKKEYESDNTSGQFLKHFFVIGSGTSISMIISIITTPVITRLVGPEEYGMYSIFLMYGNLAIMVLGLGLDQGFIRFFYDKDSLLYQQGLLRQCIKLPLIASAFSSILFLTLKLLGILPFEFDLTISILLCVYIIVQIVFRYGLLVVRLKYHSKQYALLNILHKGVYVLLVILFAILIHSNYMVGLSLSIILSSAVCLIISIAFERKNWYYSSQIEKEYLHSNRELLKYSFPFVITLGLTTLFQAIDKISLNHYCTYTDVGVYTSAMQLIGIFSVIQTTFNSLWSPLSIEHFTKNPKDKSFYSTGNRYITVIMFFIGITVILCKDIFALFLGEKYREASYVLPFLVFNPIMYTISETTVSGLVFMKKSRIQIIVAVVSCIVNAIGNTALVPIFGPRGAAISTGLSYIVFFTMRTLLANKYFYIDFGLIKFYIYTICVIAYAYYCSFSRVNIIVISIYVGLIAFLYILYKGTVISIIMKIREYVTKIINRM